MDNGKYKVRISLNVLGVMIAYSILLIYSVFYAL